MYCAGWSRPVARCWKGVTCARDSRAPPPRRRLAPRLALRVDLRRRTGYCWGLGCGGWCMGVVLPHDPQDPSASLSLGPGSETEAPGSETSATPLVLAHPPHHTLGADLRCRVWKSVCVSQGCTEGAENRPWGSISSCLAFNLDVPEFCNARNLHVWSRPGLVTDLVNCVVTLVDVGNS